MSYDIEIIRHSLAHVMAAAVKKLHPDVKFAGGPAIENGFYYDFDTEYRFSEDDFAASKTFDKLKENITKAVKKQTIKTNNTAVNTESTIFIALSLTMKGEELRYHHR